MTIKIIPNDHNNPPGKLADAELHFNEGPLDGLKLVGFAIWERRTGGGRNVTFPARTYSVNGERRSFALLRPMLDATAQDRLRELILDAFASSEEQTAAHDTVRELRITYTSTSTGPLPRLSGPGSAAAILLPRLQNEPVEICVALLVNTKHCVLGIHELARGTLDTCIVHPRDVFKVALLANAAAVIVAHNHPSGDPEPSIEDNQLCARLRRAADIIGIELLDFIIVGQGSRYVSFWELGR